MLFASVVALVITYELKPAALERPAAPFLWTDAQRDALLAMLIGIVALALAALSVVTRWRSAAEQPLRRWTVICLAPLTFVAGLAYFYGSNGARPAYSHIHDSFHYLLGPKYYAEMGYDRLYACTVAASGTGRIPHSYKVRDLSNDKMTTAGKLRAKETCKRFSQARWNEFQHDLSVFVATDRHAVRRALRDRGYNGSPTQTFLASTIANSFRLDYGALSVVTLIDVLSLCVMAAFLVEAFGLPLGLLTLLLFFCQFVDRHLIIGNSFLRYQWLAALGIGLASLKRNRYTLAGSALTASAWLNVFPALFLVPIFAKTMYGALLRRSLPRHYRRFWTGAIVASALCFSMGASHGHGLRNYSEFAEAMHVHNAAGRAPGFGVGLKYNFVYADFDQATSARLRSKQLRAAQYPVVLAAALLLLWVSILVPHLDDLEAAILFGQVGLFSVFGPTGYYFAFAAFMVLIWHRSAWDSGGLLMLTTLFAISIPPYVVLLEGAHRFYVFNRVVSATWTVYLVIVLCYLTRSHRLLDRVRSWITDRQAKKTALAQPSQEGSSCSSSLMD